MSKLDGWSRGQLIIALKLYCEIPFGRMHSRNPEILRYARLIGRTPSALAMKLTNFASLDPQIRSTGRKGLSKASQADKEIWNEMTSHWDSLASEIRQTEVQLAEGGSSLEEAAELTEIAADYTGSTRDALIEARIGQSFFRQSVLSAYDFKCCITGLAIPELLVASHIVPWRTDASNRLNPKNGLCLSAVHDRAFDIGLIAISEDFRLLLSRRLRESNSSPFIKNSFHSYADRAINLPAKFAPDPAFLRFHREQLFCG